MTLFRVVGEDHLTVRDLEHNNSDKLALKGEEVAQEDLVSVIVSTLGFIHLRVPTITAASDVEQSRVPVLDGCWLDDEDLVLPDGRVSR